MSDQKRLYRSSDRIVGGVASGIAHYLEIDPVFVRLALVMLTFFGSVGAIAYLILWVILPDERNRELSGEAVIRANFEDMKQWASSLGGGSAATLIGIALVGFGALFLLREFAPGIPLGLALPALLIAAGAYIILRRHS